MEPPTARTIAALDQVLEEMQFLIDHPRMQQKRWVAKGRTWMPTLKQAREDLQARATPYETLAASYQALWDMLARLGAEVHQRDQTSWGYRWHGGPLVGGYPSAVQALEAALQERLARGGA